ncbi:MAG: hypothetical protein R3F62_01600 [Planctomycetota bacterium]
MGRCPVCGKQISQRLSAAPTAGTHLRYATRYLIPLGAGVVLLLGAIALGTFSVRLGVILGLGGAGFLVDGIFAYLSA